MDQYINEKSMRFEALQQLREIQANLVGVSFLPVIAIMKDENPLKKSVLAFQDNLDDLTIEVQKFISEAKNGVDYAPAEEPVEDEEAPEEEKSDTSDSEEEEKVEDKEESKKKSEVEDSSEPKEDK